MRNDLVAPVWFLAGLLALLPLPSAGQEIHLDGVSEAARVNVLLAENYLRAGDLSAALEKAGRAVRRDGKSPEAHAILAMVYDRMNKQDKAKTSFSRALKIAPEAGAILNTYAVWHCQHGRYPEAEEQFAKALADPLYKQKIQALRNAAKCAFVGKNVDAAERHYRMILDMSPEDATSLETLAYLSFQKGDLLRARAFISRRDALGHPNPEMLDLAARIEEASGSASAAAEYRKRLQQLFPETQSPKGEGASQP